MPKIPGVRSIVWRAIPSPAQWLFSKLVQWFIAGAIILFFLGILSQLFQIAKSGIFDLWDTLFQALNISIYTDKIPFVAGFFMSVLLAAVLGAMLDWNPTQKLLGAIPILGKLFDLTGSIIESIKDLSGLPAVLVQTYDGIYQLGFIAGVEYVKGFELATEDYASPHTRPWKLFGVPLNLVRSMLKKIRFRVYYPDFPLIVNGRGGWARPDRIEWILNSYEEIFARLASAGFATELKKKGKPIKLTQNEVATLGLDTIALTEEQLLNIVEQSKRLHSAG